MSSEQIASGPVQITSEIRFNDPMPDAVDVAIVGGGVIGVFSALFMARRGLKVVVLEKGRIAGEQSSRNWGWIRQHGRDADELPIVMEATRIWEEIDLETGGKTGFRRGGITYLASDEKRQEKLEGWLDVAREHQLDTKRLSKRDVEELINRGEVAGKAHQWIGGTSTPSDAAPL